MAYQYIATVEYLTPHGRYGVATEHIAGVDFDTAQRMAVGLVKRDPRRRVHKVLERSLIFLNSEHLLLCVLNFR